MNLTTYCDAKQGMRPSIFLPHLPPLLRNLPRPKGMQSPNDLATPSETFFPAHSWERGCLLRLIRLVHLSLTFPWTSRLKTPLSQLILETLQCKQIRDSLLFLPRYVNIRSHVLPVLKDSTRCQTMTSVLKPSSRTHRRSYRISIPFLVPQELTSM